MDALILFLNKDRRKEISTKDFTIINWHEINKIGQKWIDLPDEQIPDLSFDSWIHLIPALDVWLDIDISEIHYVTHLIPTLKWKGGKLGVRLSFEPENIEKLYKDYKEAFETTQDTIKLARSGNGKETKLNLWPKHLKDFLDKKLHNYFAMRAYLLDPESLKNTINTDNISHQSSENMIPGLFSSKQNHCN